MKTSFYFNTGDLIQVGGNTYSIAEITSPTTIKIICWKPWYKTLKGWLVLLAVIAIVLAMVLPLAHAETVTSVHDGDSFHVAEFEQEVRIWGIDAPEVAPPPGVSSDREGQPYAIQARDYLRSEIEGKTVKLDCDHGTSHKRPVCGVFLEGKDVGEDLVRHGLAFNEPHYTILYIFDEKQARDEGLGVWTQEWGGIRPWDWRAYKRNPNVKNGV